MTIQLKSSLEVAKEVNMTRQGVEWVLKNDKRFPKPFAIANRYKGWTNEQIERYKQGHDVDEKQETIQLKSSCQVTKALGMSRQWIEWALKNDKRFPEPFASVNRYKGWTDEQIEQYKKDSGWYEKQEKKKIDQPENK